MSGKVLSMKRLREPGPEGARRFAMHMEIAPRISSSVGAQRNSQTSAPRATKLLFPPHAAR
jgi:hypothetical protein